MTEVGHERRGLIETAQEKTTHKREDTIKVTLKDIRYVDWIHLAQKRAQWHALVNTIINLRFP
jgi:hypothetical protein